jgi:type IV pilus assembly protein PilN
MRFTINLATRPYLDHRRVKLACIGALTLLTILLVWNAGHICRNLIEMRRLGAESAAMNTRLSGRPAGVSEKDSARMTASIRFHNAIIERKSFNWLDLLDQVENATPEGIALASLVPEKRGAELKLEGRAHGFSSVRSYLEKLEASHAFTDILLLSHRDMAVGEKGRGVQFTISCRAVAR